MPAYAIVQLTMTDETTFASYREVAGAALAKHGGKVVAGGPNSEVIEDNGLPPNGVALLAFPDAASAKAWIGDPELASVHELRRTGASTRITLLADLSA